MKNLLIFLGMLLMAGPLFAQADAATIITRTPLAGKVHVYVSYGRPDGKTFFPANGLYVVTSAGIVLLDTPWNNEETRQLVKELKKQYGKPVILCISTHWHADRTGGVNALSRQGVRTYASARTIALCREHGSPVPVYAIHKDTTFRIGGTEIRTFYPGPGHSMDNIVVWLPAEKILFGGCLVKSTEATDLGYTADGDVKAWPAAIAALRQRYPDARFVIPGHQGWGGDALQHTLDLLGAAKQ